MSWRGISRLGMSLLRGEDSESVHLTIFFLFFFESDPYVFGIFAVQSNKKYSLILNIVQKRAMKRFIYSKEQCSISHY